MLPSILVSLIYQDGQIWTLLSVFGITLLSSALLMYAGRKSKVEDIRRRDGYLIVSSGWFVAALFGSLPYFLGGHSSDWASAFFETVSGFTTTGATSFSDIEILPESILFWRSTTQWIGGMGIIVLTIAILPLLGIGGMELFASETPGPTKDKLHPRIRETARRLWVIYLMLTLLCGGLLDLGGMTAFEAANHAMCTMSSGGFSTRNASIAAWDSNIIHYTIIVFMFFAGTNFTLLYLLYQGQWKRLRNNEEFRTYLSIVLLLTGILTALSVFTNLPGEMGFRDSLFMVVSIITTTGFVTADYQSWMPFVTLLFVMMMLSGASAGSTSGGVKMVRYILLMKNTALEMKRLVHPRAIIPVRFNGNSVQPSIIYNIQAFIVLYIGILIFGTGLLTAFGLRVDTAFGAALSTLGNIGPAIGHLGPMDTFADLSAPIKILLSLLMLIGRLELFTVLILFSPYYWRN